MDIIRKINGKNIALYREPGRSIFLEYDGPISFAKFEPEVASVIDSLRNVEYEFLVIDLNYEHKNGILFIQVSNDGDYFEIEMAKLCYDYTDNEVYDNENGRYKLYHYDRAKSSKDKAVVIFRDILVNEKCPENDWIDMTNDAKKDILCLRGGI